MRIDGFENYIDGFYDVRGQLGSWIINRADMLLKREEEEKLNIQTLDDFKKRRKRVREYFLSAIGGLDFEKNPLNAECTGNVRKKDYLIKKIIFESMPGVHVTANLYMPDKAAGRLPAVLMACGHSRTAKAAPAYQKVCIDLVKNGFAVLIVDPLGQGERLQYYHQDFKDGLVRWGTEEHSYAGLQCTLTGSCIARYFIWDLVRAIDYLQSLPEVDADKIGMTGNSGGGTQTAYMLLVDERIKAGVPSCYITSRIDYMLTGQAHDSEQNIYGAVKYGLNYDDFVTGVAPYPVMINSAAYDFFCIEGAERTYERAKRIYALYGCEKNIVHNIDNTTHLYSDRLREGAVNWFIKHLKGQTPGFSTSDNIEVETPETLWCTESGNVVEDRKNTRTVFDLNLEYLRGTRYKKANEDLRQRVVKTLCMPDSSVALRPRVISDMKRGCLRYRKVFFFSEERIAVTGIHVETDNDDTENAIITVFDGGTCDMDSENELLDSLTKKGSVFVFDPRGMGAAKSREVNSQGYLDYYGTEYKLNCDAMMTGTSLAATRVFDIIRAVDYIKRQYRDRSIILAGKGTGAVYALMAAAVADGITGVMLYDMIESFESVVSTRFYRYDPRLEIYGVLKEFDLPVLIDYLRNRGVDVTVGG